MPSKAPAFTPLEFKPVEFSLTAGTDIPAPLESPPSTPGRPPTAGRGPLSSHPTSPQDTPPLNGSGDFPDSTTPSPAPASSNPVTETMKKVRGDSSANGTNNDTLRAASGPATTRGRTASATTTGSQRTKGGSPTPKNPLSPTQTVESSKRPSSVRRFLGFRSVSSSDSLRSAPNGSGSGSGRPISPPTSAVSVPRPGARERRKSNGWFGRRASVMFGMGNLDEGLPLGHHHENGTSRQGSVGTDDEALPVKKGPPPPTLPEFQTLGGELDGGSLGADDLFKDIK